MNQNKLRQYHLLNLLRGLAAFSVVIFHYRHFYILDDYSYLPLDYDELPFSPSLEFVYLNGANAVQFFWMISGWVLALNYLNSGKTFKIFLKNRFARLYPLHFLTLIFVLAIQSLSMKSLEHFQIYKTNDTYHFLLNLLGIPFIGFQRDYSFNAPVWSVSIEVVSYILFGMLMIYLSKVPKLIYFVTFVSLILFIFQTPRLNIYLYESILFFFIGVSLFKIHQYRTSIVSTISIIALVLYLHFDTVTTFSKTSIFLKNGFEIMKLNLIIPFSLIILLATMIEKKGQNFNKYFTTFCDWIGNLTYSMYLIHVPLQITIMIVFEYLDIATPLIASSQFFFVAFLIVLVFVSQLSYKYFEKPLRNFIQNL